MKNLYVKMYTNGEKKKTIYSFRLRKDLFSSCNKYQSKCNQINSFPTLYFISVFIFINFLYFSK